MRPPSIFCKESKDGEIVGGSLRDDFDNDFHQGFLESCLEDELSNFQTENHFGGNDPDEIDKLFNDLVKTKPKKRLIKKKAGTALKINVEPLKQSYMTARNNEEEKATDM